MDRVEPLLKLFELLSEICRVVPVNWLRKWCLRRWDLGRGLPFCRFFRLSGGKVERAFVEALEVERKGVCDPLGDAACGFFIALLATTAKALGNGYGVGEYLRERYGEYCTKEYSVEDLPSLYVMCKALGMGKTREMKKRLKSLVKAFKGMKRGGYDRERVELALGIKNYYDIPEALCVPFAKVYERATETSEVVKACKKLKVAIEEAVDSTNMRDYMWRLKRD